jgi:hypothetical protein
MDDTAFFYSRTLRIIVILAVVAPLVIIGGLFWYYSADDSPEPLPAENEPAVLEDIGDATPPAGTTADDENPLKPIGPKASTRLIPGGSVCPSCGGAGCPVCR